MAKHQDLSSPYAIHPFAYSSNADPANDGSIDTTPYKGWINTGNSNLLKVRNAADTAWESVSVDGAATAPAFGSNSTSVTTYNDNAGTLASASAHHHIGVTSIAHSSNTYSGPITLTTPGNTVGITSSGMGQLAFTAAAGSGGGGDITSTTNPELKVPTTGTTIDMSAAATGTGVTATDAGDGLTLVKFTDNTHQYWDVTNALGTGDFDLRCRIIASGSADISAATATTYGGLVVTDSSRTAATRHILCLVHLASTTAPSYIRGILNASFDGNPATLTQYPIILRMSRSGTTLSKWYSLDEARSWTKTGTATTAVDFQKVGLNANNNSGGNPQFVVDRIWLA